MSLLFFELISSRLEKANRYFLGVTILIVIGCGYSLFTFVDLQHVRERLDSILDDAIVIEQNEDIDNLSYSAKRRYYIYKATIDMIAQRPVYGWGAGCFRYPFPSYKSRYPVIDTFVRKIGQTHIVNGEKRRVRVNKTFEWVIYHAHSDVLQYCSEVGIGGCSIIILGMMWMFGYTLRHIFGMRSWLWLIAFGMFCTFLHSFFDSIFLSASVLLQWTAMIVIILRYLSLDSKYDIMINENCTS